MEKTFQNEGVGKEEYKKYLPIFKNQLLIRLLADFLYIIVDILFLFLPIFEMEILGFTEEFSLIDEIKGFFKEKSFANISIYILIMLIPMVISQIVRIFKDILSFTSLDMYVYEKYKKTLIFAENENKRQQNSSFLGITMFISVIMFAFGIKWVYGKISSSLMGSGSAFIYFNGLSNIGVIVAVIATLSGAIDFYELLINRRNKMQILQDKKEMEK